MPQTPPRSFALRPLEKTDLPQVARWFHNLHDLARFDRFARVPQSVDATEKAWGPAISGAEAQDKCWFAIEDDAQTMVGMTGLEAISSVNRDAVIPLFIHRPARRHGIGIRATALMLDLAFFQFGLNRVSSYYRADNQSSRDLTERVGFQAEGRMRQAWFADGQFFDMMVIGVLRQDWEARRDALVGELDTDTVVTFDGTDTTGWCWPPRQTDG